MMAIMVPLVANAQTSNRYNRNKTYKSRTYKKPSTYQKHRNVINIGVGTGAGALIGALLGGKKGALIGAGVGAGSSAIYSYGINPKKKKTRRYYRRP